jgi:predicted Zn-dependent peptidase
MQKFILTFFSLLFALSAQTKVDDVKSFTLKNGMKFLIVEDHSIPNANMYIFWKVGSRNEYPGITGLSHFFEHMMFNGSKKYGPKMFDRTMEAAGGANNAYTSEDVTVYTDWFPASSLETIFDLEADRIRDLSIDDDMVESERGVVASERRTGLENSNWRLLSEQVKSAAFLASPYRWSVIGYESDIENWSKADLTQYFKTYYAPNNAVVVMVGDLNFADVKAKAKDYFESIPAQAPPRKIHTIEPEQNGERRIVYYKDVPTPVIMAAYHVPEAKHEDFYALDLFNTIISDGESSRLYKEVVDKKQLATAVYTDMPTAFAANLFYFYAPAASPETKTAELESAIYAVLDSVANFGVSKKELQKAKNIKLSQFYNNVETINNRANSLGTYELFFGSYKELYQAPEKYNKVTLEDIQRVAKKYFHEKNRTVGVLTKEKGSN